MGQRQSGNVGADAADQAPTKTSYYELLGVDRQATEEEIKKAYRRKALELHPDRNYGREEQATKLFSEISAAYEVLSDPQERAWYDSHESAILGGGHAGSGHFQGNVKVTTTEEVVAMVGKFNGRVRFDDSPKGFYGFLREAFATLAKEEEISADIEGVDVPDYPTFGHQDDAHEDVVSDFYRGWAGFSTCKSFAWLDIYRLNEAPDRRVRRLMEKENQVRRDEGIRDFNNAVRALVAFVRKRDPRYKPNTQSDEERQKALRDASAAQAARARAANAAKADAFVPEWAQTREPEDEVEISDDEIEEELFECVACNKSFKSEKQFETHEKSKKHQKAVHALRRKMQKDNARLHLDDEIPSSSIVTSEDDEASELPEEDLPKVSEVSLEDNAATSDQMSDTGSVDSTLVDEAATEPTKAKGMPSQEADDDDDSDYAPRSKVKSRLVDPVEPDQQASTQPAEKKIGKAAQKRAKKAAKAAEADAIELKFKCVQCNAAFPSKTQMFQHLKDFGHAAPVPASGKVKGSKKR